jgi:hypothetical protein
MRISGSILLLSLTAVSLGIIGCSKTQSVSAAPPPDANGNLAPVGDTSQAPQTGVNQPVAPAYNDSSYAQNSAYDETADDSGPPVYAPEPPPPLPDYSQPPCPGDNYIWTPGYWSYADTGYYWVPGVWVLAPYVDALWTPPYWEFYGGRYRWHRGYWGNHIGFYGGINYGFGYTGRGYYGGYWNQGKFAYNRAVNNVNVTTVHNVYEQRVNNATANRISYNGGRGGINARPIAAEAEALRERRTPPVAAQDQHARAAEQNRQQFASVNRGRPAVVAQSGALATPYRAPAARPTGPELPRRVAQNEPAREPLGQRGVPAQVPAQARPAEPRRDLNRPAQPQPVTPVPQRQAPAQRPEIPQARPQPTPQHIQPEQGRPESQRRVPQPEARPTAPQPRQAPQVREAQPQTARPQVERRPQPQAQARPEPPRPQPQARPEPAARPAPAPQAARPAAPPQQHGRGDEKDRRQ